MIVSFENLPEIRKEHKGKAIVLAGGVFDLVHEGHVAGMQYCKSMGEILVVGVSTDERVKQRKGRQRPIRNERSRLIVVDALKPVDYSFLMPMPNDDTPTIQAIKMLQPNMFADHVENRHRWEASRDQLGELGVELVYNVTNRLDSTTDIISRILVPKGTDE